MTPSSKDCRPSNHRVAVGDFELNAVLWAAPRQADAAALVDGRPARQSTPGQRYLGPSIATIVWLAARTRSRLASRSLSARISIDEKGWNGKPGHDGNELLVASDVEDATASADASEGPDLLHAVA
jgi:hypothetical protein